MTSSSRYWRVQANRWLLAASVAGLAQSGRAQAITPASGQLALIKAHSTQPKEVCLELPEGQLDWKAIATNAMGLRAMTKPSVDSLREHFFEPDGGSPLPFVAPASPAVTNTDWLVLYHDGLGYVHPTFYRGTAFWKVNRETFAVEAGPAVSGQACATLRTERKGAAFALTGAAATSWTTAPAPRLRVNRTVGSSKRIYTMAIDGVRYTLESEFESATRARIFRRPGTTLLLVVWPLEGCAEYATLYEAKPHGVLQLLGESGSRCYSD